MDSQVMRERFLRWIGALERREKLVRVKGWLPSWDRDCQAVAWPLMLTEQRGTRMTVQPIWDRTRLRWIREGKP